MEDIENSVRGNIAGYILVVAIKPRGSNQPCGSYQPRGSYQPQGIQTGNIREVVT